MLLGLFISGQMLLESGCSFGRLPVVSQSCSRLLNSLSGLEHVQLYEGEASGVRRAGSLRILFFVNSNNARCKMYANV